MGVVTLIVMFDGAKLKGELLTVIGAFSGSSSTAVDGIMNDLLIGELIQNLFSWRVQPWAVLNVLPHLKNFDEKYSKFI